MSEQHIVIVGGGFSGTALAVHLGRLGQAGLRVTLIEPRSQLAQGVAYSTADPAHRLNVPASRMQLTGEEEGSFDSWYRASDAYVSDPAARWHDGHVYPQRRQFARWVNAQFEAAQRESPVVLAHLQDRAVAFRDGTVSTAAGKHLAADIVVLAVSHPAPSLPGALTALADHPAIIADPWQENALASVGPEERIAIVGSGLTMADMVATLDRQGHRGPVTVFSRRGQLPRPNISQHDLSWSLEGHLARPAGVRCWLRRIRQDMRLAAARGLPWQVVFDEVRRQGQTLWQSLPLNEQRRFLRHLRPWWDVHRYRIAPQAGQVLNARLENGSLQVMAARLTAAESSHSAVRLHLQTRSGEVVTREVDKVIVTTGPAHGKLVQHDALLRQLCNDGVIRPDPLALGIDVNALSQTRTAQGHSNSHLYVVGPAARGRFGELMGLPQVAMHAEAVARQLLNLTTATLNERCPLSLTD
ncbi:FAD/NAD(P)-binding protein [Pantoea stewartii]|uniref:FAD/NAD(P)-binding protein n=1 Tax=Pantoea stewartii TaxID=66269 RepID=UPI00197DD5C8|nr:FAD/NAD(P)-binding protein [Pantoea stewartii]